MEIPMRKSCTGDAGCFDNILSDDTTRETFSGYMDTFNLNISDYTLDCAECELDRGGFIKGRGIYQNKTRFEFYYHWGWCSSGGADCGWTACFTWYSNVEDEVYRNVKNNLCNNLYSTQSHDEYACTVGGEYDNTTAARSECLSGAFEEVTPEKRTISISQYSGRCTSTPEKGEINCLGI